MAVQELYKSVDGTNEVLYPVTHTDAVVDMPARTDGSGYVRPGDMSPMYGHCTGVLLGYDQSVSNAVRYVGGSVDLGTGDFSIEFYGNLYGSSMSSQVGTICNGRVPAFYTAGCFAISALSSDINTRNGIGSVIFDTEADSVTVNKYVTGTDLFHLVVTRSGVTVRVYMNGALVAEKEQSVVKDLGDFQLCLANSNHVVFCRLYNYALIQNEVNELWNGGRPYKVGVPYHFLNRTNMYFAADAITSHTWVPGDATESVSFALGVPYIPNTEFEVVVKVSDYVSGSPSITMGGTTVDIPAADGVYYLTVVPASQASSVTFAGGSTASDRSLTVEVVSVVCLGVGYQSDFSAGVDSWVSQETNVSLSATDGVLELTASESSDNYNMVRSLSFTPSGIYHYRISVSLAEPITVSPSTSLQVCVSNASQTCVLSSSVGTSTSFSGVFYPYAQGEVSNQFFVYFIGVNAATTIRVSSISLEPLGCIAEYVPAGLTETGWRDTVGHNDLTAYNSPTLLTTPLPDMTHFTISTGVFYTNISMGTANKDIEIPAGYVVEGVRVDNFNSGVLWGIYISDTDGHFWVTTSGVILASGYFLYSDAPYINSDRTLNVAPVDITGGFTLRVNASDNTTTGGMEVRVYCRCIVGV